MKRNEIDLEKYAAYLRQNEKSAGTIEKYVSEMRHYEKWLKENRIRKPMASEERAKEVALMYKDYLKCCRFSPSSVNVKLAALNSYFRYVGYDISLRYLKMQRRIFVEKSRVLTLNEYRRLVSAAREEGKEKIALIMETMASTGMRVSELQYVTVENIAHNKIRVDLKNKIRTIIIPDLLLAKLYKYVESEGIQEGEIFRTETGRPMRRRDVWCEMKAISRSAGVAGTKVFPHNMRHVFARTYWKQSKDLARLADILGHSSLETTRVYLMDTTSECERQINKLGIVC